MDAHGLSEQAAFDFLQKRRHVEPSLDARQSRRTILSGELVPERRAAEAE